MGNEALLDLFRQEIKERIAGFVARKGCHPDVLFMPPDDAQMLFGTSGEGVMFFEGLLLMVTFAVSEPELAHMGTILDNLPNVSGPHTLH
jgi:hypothetical protein